MEKTIKNYAFLFGTFTSAIFSSSQGLAETPDEVIGSSGLTDTISPTSSKFRNGWNYGFSFNRLNFDSEVTNAAGVDESANSFGITAQYFLRPEVYVSLGAETVLLDDNSTFSQVTENSATGQIEVSESSASVFPVEAEVGYNLTFDIGMPTMLAVSTGYSQVLTSKRDINNCTNCLEEDIDIDGGLFAGVSVALEFSDEWAGQLRFRNYVSGDFRNSLGIGVKWAR